MKPRGGHANAAPMRSQASILVGAASNLRRYPLSYILGRFVTVRHAYGTARHLAQLFSRDDMASRGQPLLHDIDIDAAVTALSEQAVYAPLQLPSDVVSAIHRFAIDGMCRRQERPPVFHAADVQHGRLPSGELVALADVLNADRDEAVSRVANEPSVLAIVARYLGYVPTRKDIRLIWSFVCDASLETRLKEGQTVVYHYDVHSYNFVYANYYITDVDANAGAHTMIVGSHTDKPSSWLLGSSQRSTDEIRAHYSRDREITLTGSAGFGFIQDASCYHRALAPVARNRLMLQIRYF